MLAKRNSAVKSASARIDEKLPVLCRGNMSPTQLQAREVVRQLRPSRIREVANAGLGRGDILAFWFGEPDEPTPAFIREAAVAALAAEDTFYTRNLGLPELRAALAHYVGGLQRPVSEDSVAVTSSGMSALMLVTQALVGPGDRVVAVTPLWPNLVEIPQILGARVVTVSLEFSLAGWSLDLDRLLAALTPGTRALYLNSPNNPTGWVLHPEQARALLHHCRRLGIWIVGDDAYERLFYGRDDLRAAPSLLGLSDPEDRLVSTNTFSKAWLMTGWRLGWLCAPAALMADLGKLIEYNTSCAPPFIQRAALVALAQGEPLVERSRRRLLHARDRLVAGLRETPRLGVGLPEGAMYAFFRVDAMADSLAFCKDLVAREGLGLAPGIAFGPEGEGFLRWCFAARHELLDEGLERLRRHLSRG